MDYEIDTDRTNTYVTNLRKQVTCPLCGSGGMNVYSSVKCDMPAHTDGCGTTMPLLPIICHNCGFTAFINPFLIGLVKNREAEGAGGGDGAMP